MRREQVLIKILQEIVT